MANRVWQHHFGQAIVASASNFGKHGDLPSHPNLLDWLACELRDSGGHLKPLHKQIVLSKTYRQASEHRDNAAQVDGRNALLWKYPPHRLDAEAIRDSILLASGKLNLQMGGPGVKPKIPAEVLGQSKRNTWPNVKQEGPEHWRRSVYVYAKRQLPMPLLSLFDTPDAAQSCAIRFRSTTPTQSLALLNDAFVNEQARFVAEAALEKDPSTAVEQMFQNIWALPPSPEKVANAKAFVAAQEQAHQSRQEAKILALTDLAVVLFNSSQFIYVD